MTARHNTLRPVVLTLGLAALTLAAVAFAAPAAAPAAKAAPGAKLKVTNMTMVVGHRAFTDFRDRVTVKLGETFRVGDSEYSAKVVEFQPDFTMDLKTRKVTSRSQEPKNPAAKVYVWKNGAPDDTSWAFLNMPPHFGRNSMLAFELTHVEFENHAAVDAPRDTGKVTVKAGGHKP
ncbi:MAG: hypothetical protein ABL977_02920 [Candidatus Eisenbacteria bacterium]